MSTCFKEEKKLNHVTNTKPIAIVLYRYMPTTGLSCFYDFVRLVNSMVIIMREFIPELSYPYKFCVQNKETLDITNITNNLD